VSERNVHEVLREVGLEYNTADYFSTRQVVIVLDPEQPDSDQARRAIQQAMESLEAGLSS
jgi:hypothetical protein